MGVHNSLNTSTRDTAGLKKAANDFVGFAHNELEEKGSKEVVQAFLPEIKTRKKITASEVAEEEHSLSTEDQYGVKVHNIIII